MTDIELEAAEAAKKSFNVIRNVGDEIVIVHPGDIYEFVTPMSTRAGHIHSIGSRLTVLAMTDIPAWGEVSASGFNWYCETKHGLSVWTTLELCISRRQLRKIQIDGHPSRSPML